MNDVVHVLRNMSVPPKSVVQYRGLEAAATTARRGAIAGRIIAFRFPGCIRSATPLTVETVLRMLTPVAAQDPAEALIALIEARAAELPLPDGALIVARRPEDECIWPDLLSLLTIATKSTGRVWLRSKQPSLSCLAKLRPVSLVVPPALANRIPEKRS